ncbi:hypothetical protein V2J09_010163 [Rumex salicifolius]
MTDAESNSSKGSIIGGGFSIFGNFWRCFVRRKRASDSADGRSNSAAASSSGPQLAKALSVLDITAIGIGTTIGAGIYILVGTVAREFAGPALGFSFIFAALAAGLSAVCYAEVSSRIPSAGNAYHYSYVCAGEGVAWLIGWALMLEYTIGGSAIARGISPNLALLFGSKDSLPAFLSHYYIPFLDITVDPLASILIFIVTGLLCLGIKESALVQAVVTSINVCALAFIILVGGYLCFKTGWPGYDLPGGIFPLGINGMLAGSATVFFAYIGFDCIASTAEEMKNPQRDLPLGITFALSICCALYMLVSIVIVGLVPYSELDPDTPISSAFSSHGLQWAMYIITAGAITALFASLMGSFLPQPRVLMTMARDGLLPSFFSDVSKHTQVPVKSTIITGTMAAALALFMDVSQLAGMVSAGTLLAFTIVAISILILRYVPPHDMCLQDSNQPNSPHFSGSIEDIQPGSSNDVDRPLIRKDPPSQTHKRKVAGWAILLTCLGVLLLTLSASDTTLLSIPRFIMLVSGGTLLLSSLFVLSCMDQHKARLGLRHNEAFYCPFVPILPVSSILINVYLMVNLGSSTWIRVSLWLAVGMIVYILYGRTHSRLKDETANTKNLHGDSAACFA